MMIGWEKLLNIQDLIETQWNVNIEDGGYEILVGHDLIEIQWNVNK